MKRRLTIARSLVNDPELLLLDEPTTGLDPQARHVVWDRLFRLKQQGVTLVADDALHGRGGAALRPARRHGPRRDRRRGLAARADPSATRRARSSSCASTDERPRGDRRRSTASVERVEELPDRVLLYTDDGDATAAAVARARAAAAERRSSAAARSRTSSSASPAARWSTDVDGLLSRCAPYEYWLASYRRVWRGRSSRARQPGALPGGARRRARHDRRPGAEHAGRRPVPRLRRARACSPPRRCRSAAIESSWPVMGAIKWTRQYHAMLATPLRVRDLFVGHLLYVVTRVLASAPRLPRGRSPRSARCTRRWAILAIPVAVLIGTRVLGADRRAIGVDRDRRASPPLFRFVIMPMFLFSARSSRSRSCRSACELSRT